MSASGAEPWLNYTFTWHCLTDACPKCQRLDGMVWGVGQDLFSHVLVDPVEGEVWDLDGDFSLAHPNCRCQLEVHAIVDYSRLEEFQVLAERMKITGYPEEMNVPQVAEMRGEVSQLKMETGEAVFTLRECEYILFRTTRILSRMGLPPEIDSAITKIQRMIMIVRMLHSAMIAVQMGTPYGWIMGGISVAGTVISAASLMEMERPTY